MPDQIYIGNFAKGFTTNRLPFNIDNDAFPTMYNFYSWRGRAKRKRGTTFLGQLTRQVQSIDSPKPWQYGPISQTNGEANLLVFLGLSPKPNAITNIVLGSPTDVTIVGHIFMQGQIVNIVDVTGTTQLNGNYYTISSVAPDHIFLNVDSTAFTDYITGGNAYLAYGPTITPGSINITKGIGVTFTEPSPPDGTLLRNMAVSAGSSINYATGTINTAGASGANFTGTFAYFPGLPVMGLTDFDDTADTSQYPVLLAFDTTYSYQCNQFPSSASFYSTSYYKNSQNPVTWNGADYQQFWSANYQSAEWVTNGVPGMHFVNGTYGNVGSGTNMVTFNFQSNGANYTQLVINDQLWFNEWPSSTTINGITGFVSDITNAATGDYIVTFPDVETVSSGGIAQTLTNSTLNINGLPQDGIRWYDGDPAGPTGLPTTAAKGWVNFAPPLTGSTQVQIDDSPPALYYLVGALAILPFKDRLLFFAPIIQTSAGLTSQILLEDTVLWSWNGTPYYNSVTPVNQIFDVKAYYVDQTGLGGYLPAGIDKPIMTISNNEDVLLIGFGGNGRKTRFAYTGNDLQPFLFFNINSELPSTATFSSITLDKGALDIGAYGLAMTDQQSSERIDLQIPDSIFQIQALNNGMQRVNAIRDFFREWIYFSYPANNIAYNYPTQTFLYNYRDVTWAILYENFTTHGNYRASNIITWGTLPYQTWAQWTVPWNSGSSETLFPNVIAGNPQGFILVTDQGTGEAQSGTIDAIQNFGGFTQITSKNHCVLDANPNTATGDFLYIENAIGLLTSTITGITLGTTTTILTTNTFLVGQNVLLNNIIGTTELNGNTYTILSASGSQIVINVDSTNFDPWTSAGTVQIAFNMQVGQVIIVIDNDNFVVNIPFPAGIYVGLGTYARLSQPLLQTKQFPFYWDQGRQTRLSVQKYLMDTTAQGQVTVQIYLSQNPDDAWNDSTINPPPNSLVYSQIMFTCPESTNLGLTPFNTNLQMPTAIDQKQIWHRYSTSLQGDSVQIGITLSNSQMMDITLATSEITLHGMQLTVAPGPSLC